jgi:hypothetical protein
MAPKVSPSKPKQQQQPPLPSTPVKSSGGLRQRVPPANGASAAGGAEPATTPGGGTLHVQLEPQGDGQYRIHAPVRHGFWAARVLAAMVQTSPRCRG